MRIIPDAFVLTIKLHFGVKRIYCMKVNLCGKDNSKGKTRINAIQYLLTFAVTISDT